MDEKINTINATVREKHLLNIQKWLYLEDTQAVDLIMATTLSIYLLGDPVWLFLIGPPGSTKTELLRALSGPQIYPISSITPQTLISGLNSANEVDLLPEINGKVLVVKDFTSILSKKSEDKAAIFADLREAYDGSLAKAYGSGVGTKKHESRFGIIAGVTNVIDMHRSVHSRLGERFLVNRQRNGTVFGA